MIRETIGRSGRGAAAVEFALVMPVFLTLLLGMLECARLGMAVQVVTSAAREGCRVAALPGNTATTAQTRVNTVLSQAGFPSATITLNPSDPTTATGGTAISLSLSIPFSKVSWLGTSSFMNTIIRRLGHVRQRATLTDANPRRLDPMRSRPDNSRLRESGPDHGIDGPRASGLSRSCRNGRRRRGDVGRRGQAQDRRRRRRTGWSRGAGPGKVEQCRQYRGDHDRGGQRIHRQSGRHRP